MTIIQTKRIKKLRRKNLKKEKVKHRIRKNNKKTPKSDDAKSKKDSYSADEEEEEIKNKSSKKRKVEQNKREEKKTPKSEAKLDRRSEDNISVASRASSIGRRSPSTSSQQRNVENTRSTSSRKSKERLRNHS
ncbi:nucleolar protein 58-like [Homalodisca vitripennis]|uniref:nucleolar protein 58-like n=1 Tax=Homalodisca vitripennis TaxID=197043 RepID=UPI001EE9E158|nr:nucleolar protein 58-like [Homalodisca vitripennis]